MSVPYTRAIFRAQMSEAFQRRQVIKCAADALATAKFCIVSQNLYAMYHEGYPPELLRSRAVAQLGEDFDCAVELPKDKWKPFSVRHGYIDSDGLPTGKDLEVLRKINGTPSIPDMCPRFNLESDK